MATWTLFDMKHQHLWQFKSMNIKIHSLWVQYPSLHHQNNNPYKHLSFASCWTNKSILWIIVISPQWQYNKLKVSVSEDNVSAMSKSAFEITTSTNIQSFFDTLSCYCSFKSITKLLYFVHHICVLTKIYKVLGLKILFKCVKEWPW